MTAIRIGHLDSRYVLAAGVPGGAGLQARLDRVASERLAPALERLAGGLPQANAEEVWLIRELDVELTVDLDAAASSSAVAEAWSAGVLTALRSALADGSGVVRFASVEAWTAAFVADLVAGSAWERWHYRAFASLRALPVAQAVVEAIVREPTRAAGVVGELARAGRLELVLQRLSSGQARRVNAAMSPSGSPGPASARAFVDALVRLTGALRSPVSPHHDGGVLRALAAASAAGVPLPSAAAALASGVLALSVLVSEAGDPGGVGRALARESWVAALRAAGADLRTLTAEELEAADALRAAADGDAAWTAALAASLTPGSTEVGDGGADTLATGYGGLLLLWPVVVERWVELVAGRAAPPEPELAAAQRVLLCSHLFGASQRRGLLRDPVLALLCGLDRPPVPALLDAARAGLVDRLTASDVAEGAHTGGPRDDPTDEPFDAVEALAAAFAGSVLRRFAARLPGFGGSSPAHLRRNFLDVPATLRRLDDGWHAVVSGPPLQVVLHMAGMTRRRLDLPWSPTTALTVEVAWT